MKADLRRPWSGRNSACIISFQGFYFSRPLPAEDFASLARQGGGVG